MNKKHFGGKDRSLVNKINAWQNQRNLVHCGGARAADWTNVNVTVANYTYLMPAYAFLQHTLVRRISIYVSTYSASNYKFKVFRWNSTTSLYDIIADVTYDPGGTGLRNIDLSTPIAVQPGDIPGTCTPTAGNAIRTGHPRGGVVNACLYIAGDQVASVAPASLGGGDNSPSIDCLGYQPFLAVTGDSIVEGHNNGGSGSVNSWHTYLHSAFAVGQKSIPGGNILAEPTSRLRTLTGGGNNLQFQNLALGGKTFAWVLATGLGWSIAAKPYAIWIDAGINDVADGRSWADMETDLDAIKAAITTEKLLISETLPWNAGTDANAQTIRDNNASLAVWCAANGATLILCHDEMAKIRVSTGELDDMKTAYNYDNVHMSLAGVTQFALIVKRYLKLI